MAAQSSEELQELFQFSLDANQLQDAESKAEALLAKNAELHGEIEKQRASQAEIYFYLQSKLDDNNQVIRKLEEQCASEGAAHGALVSEHEAKVAALEREKGDALAKLRAEMARMTGEVAVLREFERRRAEQQRGDELAVSSVYVHPPAELLVEAIAVYRAAYALAKQQQEEYDGEPTLKFAWAVAGDILLEFIARRER